jgi:hypothetical protein
MDAFESHMALVIESAGVIKIDNGSHSAFKPDLVSDTDIRKITRSGYAQQTGNPMGLMISFQEGNLQIKSGAVSNLPRRGINLPDDSPAVGV